jgi:hypothetical protein
MMRYRLRTLLILLAILPPMVAWTWFGYWAYCDYRERQRLAAEQAKRDLVFQRISSMSPVVWQAVLEIQKRQSTSQQRAEASDSSERG